MRTKRAVTALAATALAAAAITGTAAAAPAAHGCTPTWKLAATPHLPALPPGEGPWGASLAGASVVSGTDAWFPGFAGLEPWVLHWDGRTLSAAPSIPQGPFTERTSNLGGSPEPASFDSATDGWVLGTSTLTFAGAQQYAAHWSGGRWTITPLPVSPNPTTLEAPVLVDVASVSPSDAWAVGHYQGQAGALIEHWDGTQWRIVPNPLSSNVSASLGGVAVVSPTDIWVLGERADASGVPVPVAEHWNGTAWTVVPMPAGAAESFLGGISVDGPRDIWAVGGQHFTPGTDVGRNWLIEHWNGTAWRVVTGLPHVGGSHWLGDVYAASPTDVWATEWAVRPGTLDWSVDNFLHWDGSKWTLVRVPGPHEYNLTYQYGSLAGSGPGNVWAAGLTHTIAGAQGDQPLLARLSCGA